jgi:hypothetical protein
MTSAGQKKISMKVLLYRVFNKEEPEEIEEAVQDIFDIMPLKAFEMLTQVGNSKSPFFSFIKNFCNVKEEDLSCDYEALTKYDTMAWHEPVVRFGLKLKVQTNCAEITKVFFSLLKSSKIDDANQFQSRKEHNFQNWNNTEDHSSKMRNHHQSQQEQFQQHSRFQQQQFRQQQFQQQQFQQQQFQQFQQQQFQQFQQQPQFQQQFQQQPRFQQPQFQQQLQFQQ